MTIKEDNSAGGWIVGNLPGTLPNPIPQKFIKKASGQQSLVKKVVKEEEFGFADASAPSNGNYQTELSPTTTAEKKKMKRNKSIKERYERKLVELAQVCPACHNTGVMKQFGNNMLCKCTYGEDKRVDQENLMFNQAKDMLSTGHTTAVNEEIINEVSMYRKVADIGKDVNKNVKPEHRVDTIPPGRTVWRRGDGSSYRDPGKIHGHKTGIEATWNHIKSQKGAKPVGHMSGEFRISPRHETIKHNGVHYTNKGSHIEYGAASRTKNSSVWNIKKEDVATSLDDVAEARYVGTKVYDDEPKKVNRVVARRTTTTVGGEYNRVDVGTKGTIHTSGEGLGGKVHFIKWDGQKGVHCHRADDIKKLSEDVVTSLDDVADILEAYKPSDKLKSRTKYLVQPKLSKMLRDRLAARGPAKKAYTPSARTLGLAAQRKAQMSKPKTPSPKGYPEEVKALDDVIDHPHKAHKKVPVKEGVDKFDAHFILRNTNSRGKDFHSLSSDQVDSLNHYAKQHKYKKSASAPGSTARMFHAHLHRLLGESINEGGFDSANGQTLTRDFPLKPLAKKPNLSAHTPGKEMSALSMKPMMGSSNDNRMSEGTINESWGEKHHSFKDFKDNAEQFANRNTHDGKVEWEHKEVSAGGKTWHQSAAIVHDPHSNRHYITGVFNHTHGPHSEEGHGQHLSRYSSFNEEKVYLADGESKKFTGDSKKDLKRKYLGVMRGRTATGKPAHPIEVDPVIKTNTEVNKVVK